MDLRNDGINEFSVTGLCAAPYTPFDAAGSLDLDRIPEQVQSLKHQGVFSVFGAAVFAHLPHLTARCNIHPLLWNSVWNDWGRNETFN